MTVSALGTRNAIITPNCRIGVLPLLLNPACPVDDGDREGILSAPGALAAP